VRAFCFARCRVGRVGEHFANRRTSVLPLCKPWRGGEARRAGLAVAWAGRGGLAGRGCFPCGWPHAPGWPGRAVVVRWFVKCGLCPTQRAADAATPRANVGGISVKNHAPTMAVDGDAAPLTLSLGYRWSVGVTPQGTVPPTRPECRYIWVNSPYPAAKPTYLYF